MSRPVLGKNPKGHNLYIDVPTLIESRLVAVANSGAGKSWILRRFLEQTHGKIPQFVIDPDGEFSSLREKYDYVLVGGEGADIQADPRSAGLLARRLLELGVSAILDIYELKKPQRKLFVKNFVGSMVEAPKKLWRPVIVVIDEAHDYAPEKGSSVSSEEVIDLMSRGRKRGFCGILATQRVSKLSKDAMAEANNYLIGRCALDRDKQRAADELGIYGKREQNVLRELQPGEFFAFGPALTPQVSRVNVGPVVTTHPKAGQRAKSPPPPRSAIKKLVAELSDLPEKVAEEVRDLQAAKAIIKMLRHDLKKANKTTLVDQEAIDKAVSKAVAAVEDVHAKQRKQDDAMLQRALKVLSDVMESVKEATTSLGLASPGAVVLAERLDLPDTPVKRTFRRPAIVVHATPEMVAAMDDPPEVTAPQAGILKSIAWWEAADVPAPTRMMVAFMADRSPKASGFRNLLSSLSTAGWITYPQPGTVRLTPDGRQAAPDPGVIPSTYEFLEAVYKQLKEARAGVFRAAVDAYPNALSREDLAAAAGRSPTASGFRNIVSALSTLDLIHYPQKGYVQVSSFVFLDDESGNVHRRRAR